MRVHGPGGPGGPSGPSGPSRPTRPTPTPPAYTSSPTAPAYTSSPSYYSSSSYTYSTRPIITSVFFEALNKVLTWKYRGE